MQTNGSPRALQELEEQFARSAPDVPDGVRPPYGDRNRLLRPAAVVVAGGE